MGIDMFVGIYTEENTAAQDYFELVTRLLDRGKVVKAEQLGFRSSKGSSHFVSDDLTNKIAGDGLKSVAEQILLSDKWLSIRFIYTLQSGRVIPLDAELFGYKFDGGYQAKKDGFIRLALNFKGLIEPIRNMQGSNGFLITEELVELMHDEEELFFRCIGIDIQGRKQSNFPHMSAYLETSWPSPLGCSFVYHQDIAEFGTDFVRLYLEVKHRISMRPTLVPGIDIWSTVAGKDSTPQKPIAYTYWSYIAGNDKAELLDFLEKLDEKIVRRLANKQVDELKEAFVMAGELLPDVVCYDLGEAGMAVSTPPYASVWTAYQVVADLLK